MSIDSNTAFGARLRAHRERRGVTLAALAESMKVRPSLLEALERHDVSRWPPGIYGRSVVREYAKAIGLPAQETLDEFCELFPHLEDGSGLLPSPPRESTTNAAALQLRITLAGDSVHAPEVMYWRMVAALIELAAVMIVGYGIAAMSGLSFSTAAAIVALAWYPFRTVFCSDVRWSRLLRAPRVSLSRWWHAAVARPVKANPIQVGSIEVSPEIASTEAAPETGDDVHASPGYASIH
jgi:transcriptional regulator with XRE-family HTH domain